MPYDQVDSLTYLATKQSVNGVPTGTIYNAVFALRDNSTVKINFQAGSIGRRETKDEAASAFQAIVGAAAAFVEPRLRAEMIHAMQAGQTVDIGGLRMGQTGLAFKPKLRGERSASWPDVVGATFSQGIVFAFVRGAGDKREELARMSMSVPNAVVVPGLLEEAVGVFAGG